MYNRSFSEISLSDKKIKLKNVLYSKNPNINNEQLNKILNYIDMGKQYHVKFTKRIDKFKNFITDENIITSTKELTSYSVPIYGSFQTGCYINNQGIVSSTEAVVDSLIPMAALKTINETNGAKIVTSLFIIMYHP